MRHLGEDAVAPDLLQFVRSLRDSAKPRGSGRGQADQDLRRPRGRFIGDEMRAEKDPVADREV